jgi:acyl-CoA thioesterase-1
LDFSKINGTRAARDTAVMPLTFCRQARTPWFAVVMFACAIATAQAERLGIVAIGASNTAGWGVGAHNAYPARLQALLKAKGIDAHITNAGVPYDTTAHMLNRLDSAVPPGTDIVILQPGGNDARFGVPKQRRAANIAAMASRLRARNIKVIVYDEVVAPRYYGFDRIHFTAEGHAMIAASLLPKVTAVARRQRQRQTP